MSRLRDAIENAYIAFGSHRLGNRLEVCHCNCCMSEEMADSILKTPLRELSNEQLSEYTNSAHGWSEQFLYLLPRYMELISRGERPSYLDEEYILSRFGFAPENCMTASEATALDEWFLALFENTLCSPIAPEEVECAHDQQSQLWWRGFGEDICKVILMALPTPFDTARFLSLWRSCETREANLRLAITLVLGIGANHFASRRFPAGHPREQAVQWYDWFMFTDHSKRLSKAFERESDPQAQELLLAAL